MCVLHNVLTLSKEIQAVIQSAASVASADYMNFQAVISSTASAVFSKTNSLRRWAWEGQHDWEGQPLAALLPSLRSPPPRRPHHEPRACLRPGGVGLAARVNVTGKPQTVAWLIKVVRKRPEAQRLVGAAVEGVDDKTAAKYAAEAHNFCPYSKAIAGNIDVQVAASGTS